MRGPHDAEFEDFVRGVSTRLFRTAYLLTGTREAAEDLLQLVLERTYAKWPRVRVTESPEAYARRILVNAATDAWRGRRRLLGLPATRAQQVADTSIQVAERDLLRRALTTLPARQRAAVVLRFYEDLSEADTARAMGCSPGAVKSHTARALAALRAAIDNADQQVDDALAKGRPR